jgi:hypothetical protein
MTSRTVILALGLFWVGCTLGERSEKTISGTELEERFDTSAPGAWRRGSGIIGSRCSQASDCSSALCLGGFCTQDCTSTVCPSVVIEGTGETISAQCTPLVYPCSWACDGAEAREKCMSACLANPAHLCLRTCSAQTDCDTGTICTKEEEQDSYRCFVWEPEFQIVLGCMAFAEFAQGRGTPPEACHELVEDRP